MLTKRWRLLAFLFGALLTIAVPATVGMLARLGREGHDPAPRVSYVTAITLATVSWLLLRG